MHHTMHGAAFDFPPNPFLQIRVEDESQVHFRDVVLWYQRRI